MPFQPYSLNVQDISLRLEGHADWGGGTGEDYSGPYLFPAARGGDFPPYDWTNLYNRAVDKLNDKTRGGLDLSIDFAEYKQTVKMVKATQGLVELAKTAVGRFGPIKVAGSLWLQYQYGLRPLVQDIYGAADESLRVVINKTERYRARASEGYKPAWSNLSTVGGPKQIPITTGTGKRSITIGLDLRTDQFDLSRWSSLNPISIAYELTPFSFVVDWVYDIGGYLRNMETYLLYANKFRGGYLTKLLVYDFGLFQKIPVTGGFQVYTGHHKGLDIQRSVLSSYPAPYLPSFKVDLGASRMLSAASLLANALSSGHTRPYRDRRIENAAQSNVRAWQSALSVSPTFPKGYWHI